MNTARVGTAVLLASCIVLSASGCSSSSTPTGAAAETKYLGLTEPTDGFQVRSVGTVIHPGDDAEFCEVQVLPGTPDKTYYVKQIEFANGPSSHHLIIQSVQPGGPAEAKIGAMKLGDPVPCLGAQVLAGTGLDFMGGTQTQYEKFDFPAGVGRVYHGGQRVIFDYHYLNTTTEDVHAKSAANFHVADAASIKYVAQILSFNNVTIDTPPGKTASFMGECRVNMDVMMSGLTRHTHRWGTDYTVWYAGGAQDGEEIFTTADFEHGVDHEFPTPITVKSGEGFRFQCNYNNTESHPLRFGPNATDEMCILFGLWWNANDAETTVSQDCMMTQISSDGIARPVAAAGGFAKPSQADVTACLTAAAASPTSAVSSPACTECTCNSCGGILTGCMNDPDCSAILQCVTTSGCTMATCGGVCGTVINQHSPGTGMLISVGQCMQQSCPKCGGSADGGAPASDGG